MQSQDFKITFLGNFWTQNEKSIALTKLHIEELTKGASLKSGSPNEKDLLNSYLVNLSHLVNQKTFMGHLLWVGTLFRFKR